MKTMIVVRGAHKTGKTKSIKKVLDIFRKDLRVSEEEIRYVGRDKSDIHAVLKYRGKTIGINSLSYHRDILEELAKKKECDIIVCASLLGNKSHEEVLYIKDEYGYDFNWVVSQMILVKGEPLFDTWKDQIANGIVKLIDESINRDLDLRDLQNRAGFIK
jgi:predicted CopG family antitoxin